MTTGSLSVPIMRPNHCWTIPCVSILAALLLTLNADSGESDCSIEVLAQRDTVYEASPGKELWINCTVQFCTDSPPEVFWYKLEKNNVPVNVSRGSHIRQEWRETRHLQGISYLIFQNILLSDSGGYQCTSNDIVSHNINVSVSDDVEQGTSTPQTETNTTTSSPVSTEDVWMYVYSAAGILVFVILVIVISVTSMQGCKGKTKTETRTGNQYVAIPMVEQPFPHAGLQASPKGSPSLPPSRRSTRRTAPSSKPAEMPLPRDNELHYSQIEEDRGRQRRIPEEEGNSIVYAALNHQPPAAVAAARPRQPAEECSEYAVIRVKDH